MFDSKKLKQEYDFQFKILYALGMIFIVAGHCNNGGISLLYDWFNPYGFHIPMFMFCSGYFFKDRNTLNIKEFVIKKFKSLIIPLYLWNSFYAVLLIILHNFGFSFGGTVNVYNILISPINNGHQFFFNMGGWFVIPLFMIQIFNVCFRRAMSYAYKKINELAYVLLYLFLGIIGILISQQIELTPWLLVLVRFCVLLPFFQFGIYYKKNLSSSINKISNLIYFLFIFIVDLILINLNDGVLTFTYSWCNDLNSGVLMPYLVGCLGIAFWLRISRILASIITNEKIVLLIADNTYSIMINQFLGFFLLKLIFGGMNYFLHVSKNFNWELFKNDFWYYYIPGSLNNNLVLYLIAGIVFPIVLQLILNRIIVLFGKLYKC